MLVCCMLSIIPMNYVLDLQIYYLSRIHKIVILYLL